MNNIPVYVSCGGTASLILQEIPFKNTAYIYIRTCASNALGPMIAECASVCRQIGGKQIFVSVPREMSPPEGLPYAYDVLRLHIKKKNLPKAENDALELLDITRTKAGQEEHLPEIYCQMYNECFQSISHALSYRRRDVQLAIAKGNTLFLAYAGTLLMGFGETSENELLSFGVISEMRRKGFGKTLALTLMHRIPSEEIFLTAASDNAAAMDLYADLGFYVSGRDSTWYRVPIDYSGT